MGQGYSGKEVKLETDEDEQKQVGKRMMLIVNEQGFRTERKRGEREGL